MALQPSIVALTISVPVAFMDLAARFDLEPEELARLLCEDFVILPPRELTIISRPGIWEERRRAGFSGRNPADPRE